MRTINVTITVSDAEYDFLRLGKCERPNPERYKMDLLSQAARNLRNLSDSIMQGARGERARPVFHGIDGDRKPKRYKSPSQRELDARAAKKLGKGIISWKDMSPTQREAEDKRLAKRRAHDRKRALKIEGKLKSDLAMERIARADARERRKLAKLTEWNNKTAGEKDARIGPGPMLGLTLSEAKAKAKSKLPMKTDGSSQPVMNEGYYGLTPRDDDNNE